MMGGQPMGNHFEKTAGGVFMPAVIRDTIDPIVSHADGKTYESKSTYYKSLKEQGFEIIGNEKQPEKKHEVDEKRLEASILYAMAQSGLIDISQLSYEQLDMIEKEFYPEETETEDLLCHQK